MAISLIAKPQTFSPAYNQLKFIYDSTNNSEEGFRYVFDVYESGTSNKIGEYRPLPRYSDGYGEIDLSKLLQAKLTLTYSNSTTQDVVAPNNFYKYDVKVGEEYVVTYSWTANLVDNGGNVKITPTAAHPFVVGDRVSVDGGVDNPNITGLFTVIAINGTTDFTISALWSEVDDATGNGSVVYADNRKTVTRDIITSTNNYVFNGAVRFLDWNDYDEAVYLVTTTGTDKFLTNQPTDFYITPNQDVWFALCTNGVTTGRIYFENDGGDIMYYAANASAYITLNNVGSNADPSTVVSGTSGHIKTDTEYYDVWWADNTGTQGTQKYRFYIDRRCAINDYEIQFLDRMGSISSFAFQLRAYKNGTINRQTYNKDLTGIVSSSEWTYLDTAQGLTTFQVNAETNLELSTNWMSEEMAQYFEELVTSPYTILFDGSVYRAVVVQDTGYQVESQRNKKLIKKTINVKYANQDTING